MNILEFLTALFSNHNENGKSAGWKPADKAKLGGIQITSKLRYEEGSLALLSWSVRDIIFLAPLTVMVAEYLSPDNFAALSKGELQNRSLLIKVAKSGEFIDIGAIRIRDGNLHYSPGTEGRSIEIELS